MASLIEEGNGRWRIKWYEGAERKSIRLGKQSSRNADRLLHLVEDLIGARANGTVNYGAIDRAHELSDELQGKLERYGLIPNRKWANATLGGLLTAFFENIDVKPGTETTYRQTRANLLGYFGADRLLHTVTALDASEWRKAIKAGQVPSPTPAEPEPRDGRKRPRKPRPLSDATVSKRVKTARSIFREGVRWGLLRANPFDGLKAGAQTNRDRQHFVSREDAARVLDACPDAEWRLLFALSRYGGLRCPSEHLRLRWRDIDWARSRMLVSSPKTEAHEGGGSRMVPIFPELLPFLRDAYEQAPEGAEWVISRYRLTNANLRTQLERIVKRAQLVPWPRLFHNLRATRQTELEEAFGARRACDWLGNSQAVAMGHYIQTTEAHFERAAAEPTGPTPNPAPNAAPSGTVRPHPGPANDNQPDPKSGSGDLVTAGAGCGMGEEVTPRGFEPRFPG